MMMEEEDEKAPAEPSSAGAYFLILYSDGN